MRLAGRPRRGQERNQAAERECQRQERHDGQDEDATERPPLAAAARPVVAARLIPAHSGGRVRRNVFSHAYALQEGSPLRPIPAHIWLAAATGSRIATAASARSWSLISSPAHASIVPFTVEFSPMTRGGGRLPPFRWTAPPCVCRHRKGAALSADRSPSGCGPL